jgi:hypothetical protein
VTPKATEAGKATSIEAKPPQKSSEWRIQAPDHSRMFFSFFTSAALTLDG